MARVLGALRDVAIAAFLGAGVASDAFWIAFLIPNVFRRFVADEGLTGAMVPALAKAEAEEGPERSRSLAASAFGILMVANVLLCVAGVVFAEQLVLAFAWSWREQPDQFELTVTMTRWMFPFVAMVSMVSFFEGLLNFRGHFFVPKLAPGVVSGGLVAGVVLFGTRFEEPAYALVLGLMAGGVLHVLINLPPLWQRWGRVGFSLRVDDRIRAVLWEMGKVVAIGIFAQINIIVLRQLATSLPEGAVTHYHNGTRIVDLAQGIVAVGIGSALLPNLATSVASKSWDQFRQDLAGALRLAAFLLLPIAVVIYVWAEPATALLFRLGKYTYEDVQVTADAVRYLVPFLLALAAVNIIKRVYHALDDRTTLLVVGAIGVALTATLGMQWVQVLGVPGLALALSVATVAQLAAYLLVLQWRLGARAGLASTLWPMVRMTAASMPLVPLLLWLEPFGSWESGPKEPLNWMVFVGGLSLSGVGYLVMARLLGLPEVGRLTQAFTRRFRRG